MSVRDSERKIARLCDGDLNSPLRELYTIEDLQNLRLWIDESRQGGVENGKEN